MLYLCLRFIKVIVPSQENVRSCLGVLSLSIMFLFLIFSIGFWTCSDSVVFLLHILIFDLFERTLEEAGGPGENHRQWASNW
jgi:hypothetical protein